VGARGRGRGRLGHLHRHDEVGLERERAGRRRLLPLQELREAPLALLARREPRRAALVVDDVALVQAEDPREVGQDVPDLRSRPDVIARAPGRGARPAPLRLVRSAPLQLGSGLAASGCPGLCATADTPARNAAVRVCTERDLGRGRRWVTLRLVDPFVERALELVRDDQEVFDVAENLVNLALVQQRCELILCIAEWLVIHVEHRVQRL
jgi:hypothetical protein